MKNGAKAAQASQKLWDKKFAKKDPYEEKENPENSEKKKKIDKNVDRFGW